MPIYEYNCPTCGPFERLRRYAEADLPIDCPQCALAAHRIVATPSLIFDTIARRLHQRAEQSTIPRVEHRAPPVSDEPPPTPKPHVGHGRPWMVGH